MEQYLQEEERKEKEEAVRLAEEQNIKAISAQQFGSAEEKKTSKTKEGAVAETKSGAATETKSGAVAKPENEVKTGQEKKKEETKEEAKEEQGEEWKTKLEEDRRRALADKQKRMLEEAKSRSEAPYSKWGLILRSAALPGWGQITSGRELAGGAYMGSALVALLGVYGAQQEYIPARSAYNDMVEPYFFNQFGSDMVGDAITPLYYNSIVLPGKWERLAQTKSAYNAAIAFAGTVWAANMLDVTFFSPRIARTVQLQVKLLPDQQLTENKMQFSIKVNLP